MRGVPVSVGTKWPLTKARVTGRPKDGAFPAVGSPGVFHVQLCSLRWILIEFTRVSTLSSFVHDDAALPGACAGARPLTFGMAAGLAGRRELSLSVDPPLNNKKSPARSKPSGAVSLGGGAQTPLFRRSTEPARLCYTARHES